MGSGVSKSQQAKANRELEAQLKSLQSEVTRLKISSTSILKDNDFDASAPKLGEIKEPPRPPGYMGVISEDGSQNPATNDFDDQDLLGDAMDEVDQDSAIAMSTSMMVMEFLPYCKSGDKETDETIITTLRETHRKEIALDARDANGNTMLILSTMYRLVWAVRHSEYTEAAEILLKRKADPNILNYNGASALSYACSETTLSLPLVKSLLAAKAKPNTAAIGANYCTPLHYAASVGGADDVIKVMLAAGANTLSVDDEGYTAYDYAEFNLHQSNMDILFDAMRKDKPLAEGEMFYGEEYTSYNPDTTPEGYWEEDDYFEEEEEDDNQITNVLHAMDSDRRSDNGDEDENLMTSILAEKKISDNKHMIGTWRNLAWTAGSKNVTKRIEFEIAVAMKELEAIQKRSKTAGASAAKSAPMGKQKQIIDNLKQKLDDTKKQIMDTKTAITESKRKLNEVAAKNGAEASMRQAELDMRQQKNDQAKEEVAQLEAQVEHQIQSKTAGVAAMRKRLEVQIAKELQNVEKNEATSKKYEQEQKALEKQLEDTNAGIKKFQGTVVGLQKEEKDLRAKSTEIEASSKAKADAGRKAVAKQMENHRDAEMIAIMEEKDAKENEKEKLRKVFEAEVHKRHKIKAVLDDMRGHSQVFCVFGKKQPTSDEGETKTKQPLLARRVNNYAIAVKEDQKFKEHDLDHVYDPKKDTTAKKLYKPIRSLVAKKVVAGYAVTVFTYGGEDKSKTQTLMGDGENSGLAHLMIQDIFLYCAKEKKKFSVSISMKLVEICDNAPVQDLLGTDPVKFGHSIGGSVEMESRAVPLKDADEALSIASNALVSKSVRSQGKGSHVVQVFEINAQSLNKKRQLTKMGKLTLVDTTDDAHLEELQKIVEVQAIHQKARESKKAKSLPPMPPRKSPLVRLMAEGIGGNSKTIMMLHTYPSDPLAAASTAFANNLKGVENDSIVNVETAALKNLRAQLAKLVELQASRAGGGDDNPWWSPSNLPSVSRPGA